MYVCVCAHASCPLFFLLIFSPIENRLYDVATNRGNQSLLWRRIVFMREITKIVSNVTD
jgi:hypothetical protein